MHAVLMLAAISLIIPFAALVAVPSRWLSRAVIFWMTWPVLIFVVFIVWETLTKAPVNNPIGNALLGFSLISAMLLIPWLIICAVVLPLAFLLRRIFHRKVASTPVASLDAVSPTLPLVENAARREGEFISPGGEIGFVEGLRLTSPDGTVRVELNPVEWSNTHWVNPPCVTDLTTGQVVLDLWDSDWDASVRFPRPRQVLLDCRRYHVGGGLTVVLDLAEGTYQILNVQNVGGPLPAAPIIHVAEGLELASRQSAVAAPKGPQANIQTVSPATTSFKVLLILTAVFGVAAVIGYAAMRSKATGGSPSPEIIEMPEGGFRPAAHLPKP